MFLFLLFHPFPLIWLGLFLYDESTQQHWLNPNSLENDSEYQLIGLLLALAIYNNIILDIRFPLVIYRKLLGCPIDFSDLFSSHPVMLYCRTSLLLTLVGSYC